MDVLQYNDLDASRVADSFERVVAHLRAGDFRAADVKKLAGTPFYQSFGESPRQGRRRTFMLSEAVSW